MIEPIMRVEGSNKVKFFYCKALNVCRHKNMTTGQSYVVSLPNRRKMVYPPSYRVLCTNCQKEFELTKEQYEEYLRTGDIPNDAHRR